MIAYIILIIIGFILLIKGADLFVDASSSCAINLKVPKMIIALTIIAFGTSTPEFAISLQAMMEKTGDVALSNVIGSTVVNTMLAIGIAALIKPIKVRNETVKKELPLHLIIVLAFSILFIDNLFQSNVQNSISRKDGIILFLMFLIFIYYIFTSLKNRGANKGIKKEKPKFKLEKSIVFSVIGLILIFIGSDIAVDNVVNLASEIGVSNKLITMVVLVIATSTPEIVMSITSAKKGEFDMVLGNIIGTNIFNIGVVLAIPVMIFGDVTAPDFGLIDILAFVVSALLIYLFSIRDKKISKLEGFIMLFVFFTYYAYIICDF